MSLSSRNRSAYGFLVIAASVFAANPTVAIAQAWNFNPSVTVSGSYNDNIRLANDAAAENEVAGGDIDARARINRTSPTGSVSLFPRVRSSYYPDDSQEESTDVFLDFSGQHRTQTSKWVLFARFSDVEVLSAEVNDPDFDNPDVDRPITDDSGLVQVRNTRQRFIVSPGADFNISEKTNIGVVGDYINVEYDRSAGELTSYDSVSLEADAKYKRSEKVTYGIKVFGSNYEVDDNSFSSDGLGASISYERRFSPRASGFVLAGYERTDSEFTSLTGVESNSSGSTLFGLGMTRTYETSRLVLDLRRSIDPTGEGDVLVRNMFRGRFTRRLSPLLTGNIFTRYQQSSSVDELSTRRDRDYFQIDFQLDWKWTRTWHVTTSYGFTQQEFSDQPGDASSNRFRIGLRYAPPQRN